MASCYQGDGQEEETLAHESSYVLEWAPRQVVKPPPLEVSRLQGFEQLGLTLKLAWYFTEGWTK